MFSVLEGDYELFDGDRWVPFHKGEYRHALRGEIHTFRNSGSTVGQMLALVTPGGLDDYFEAISPLALPQDLERLTGVSKMFGITFIAPDGPH